MNILFFIFLFLFTIFNFNTASADDASSCPINFDYVETLPWDASLCRDPIQTSCCQTLRSLFGVGLAQHLNQTSQFYLPTATASSSCIAQFERKISSMSLTRSLLPLCFNDTAEFATTNSSTACAGITTLQDWDLEADEAALLPLESACNGDLTGLTLCSMCLEAGLKLSAYIVSSHPNSTKCFYFTVLYAAGVVNGFGPDDIRSAACIFGLPVSRSARSRPANHRTRRFIFGFCGGLVGISGLVILFFIYRKWDRKKKQDLVHQSYVSSVKSTVLPNVGAKFIELRDLEQATDKFAKRNLIGQGGFGAVYRGTLPDNKTEVAVKQIFETDSAESDDDFINEALIISKIRHRNLIPLRGFCVSSDRFHGKRRFLVYDYMPNGSLNDHIFVDDSSNNNDSFLLWPQRKNIILDIAKGLAYLHYGIKPTIYHRDIKATNILLDADMKARVADFGLAKQNLEGQSHLTTRVAGTHGYLAPEYALYGQLTEKSDVYSFGILILEIMSGRRVLDASKSERILITDWAWELVKAGKVEEVFHGGIRREGPKGVMERFVRVGILCAHVMVALRPTIEDALRMLEGDIDIPRLPDRPLPLAQQGVQMQFSSFSYGTSASEGSRVSNWSNTS